ncbi:glycosyl hydrolase 53 family protein [Paenibacillus sp. LHD-117]|uniref:glycosyl hydrolase 53 family protein n=1 Tax=Paenibacillus sp. LHD-117 TaxID=3071412 RepID=UPI0027E195B2|nr:glycosyl hydrolase 53 family protein [Paenibacillus sp. LHD-117]MDQ6419479.1 glycosyl hydrolase 53 family protein [Paenibacillus sp. LHD-117]
MYGIHVRTWFIALLIAALLLPAGGGGLWNAVQQAAAASAAVTTASVESDTGGIRLSPIAELADRPDFIRGADVSMLQQIEASGGAYYDADGEEKDLLAILKDNGVNWIRLRTWVDPTDAQGQPLGGGNNDTETTVSLAKRAKALGLKVLLDFHYSDFWTDPGEQEKPKAWHDLSGEPLAEALYDYTKEVLTAMSDENALPDMVQVGNETNGGMVWPDGKTWQQTAGEEIGGYDGWVQLIDAGTEAIREYAPNAKIVLHLANGGNNGLYRNVFNQLTNRGVDFDIIGLSYYSYWHGTLEQLRANMDDISKQYGKDVMVVETAYARTFDNGDSHGNIFGSNEENVGGYKATLQGQASSFRDVMEAVAKVPDDRGLGAFYWEPAWIPVDGAGWKTGEGNAWDNQAMFDAEGLALPSLQVFDPDSELYSETELPAEVVLVRPAALHVTVGQSPTLPATVKVEYSNDRIESKQVTWNAVPADKLQYPGTFTVEGSIPGITLKATATVTVQGAANYAANPGFETGSLSGWTVSGDTAAVGAEHSAAPAGNAYNGDYSLHYWLDEPFVFTAKQTVTNLPAGTYTLSARTHGGGGEKRLQLYALCGGERVTADIVNTGWHAWKQPTIQNLAVAEGGSCEIGVEVDGNTGSWGNIDEIMFYRDASAITLQAQSAVAQGAAFETELGVAGLASKAYSQDLTIRYDHTRFQFVEAKKGSYESALIRAQETEPGTIRILSSHPQGLSAPGTTIRLRFAARSDAPVGEGIIAVDDAKLGVMPGGAVLSPALLDAVQVNVTTPSPVVPPDSGDQGGAGEPPIVLHEDGSVSTRLTTTVAPQGFKEASAELSEEWLSKLLKQAEAGDSSLARLSIELPEAAGAEGYSLTLPAEALQGEAFIQAIELVTPLGTIRLPAGMLQNAAEAAPKVTIHIKTTKPGELGLGDSGLQAIGDRPVLDLYVTSGGERLAWSDADQPVTVTIPYKENLSSASAPGTIVVWYVDEEGNITAVPNGRYDAIAGTVTFVTTHFSHYAVAKFAKTFQDILGMPWATQAIETLAARGVIEGRGDDVFDPNAQVTRAEFTVMLTRALGFSAEGGTAFSDVAADSYYAASVKAAAKRGIILGDGQGKFKPNDSITREELAVMTVRALSASGIQLPQGSMEAFADADDVSVYAAEALGKAVHAGIVMGKSGRLMPAAEATRAEAAAIITRMLSLQDQEEAEK